MMQGDNLARVNKSARAGLQFAVPRVARFMKQGRYAERIGGGAPVYLASALQYICSEIVELAGNEAERAKKQRIKPRHVMLAIRADPELNKLLGKNADFMNTGVAPHICKEILPNHKKGGKDIQDDDIDMNEE
jgi:histone H2A